MKIHTRKSAKEAATNLGQVDGVVVNGGGPVNTTNFKRDFEEAAAKLEKLIKIGDTTTGEGKQVKAEQLKIEPAGTPNPSKDDKKKEAAAREDYLESRKDLDRWQRQVDNDLEKFGRIGGKLYDELDEAGFYLDADNKVKSKLAKEAIIDRNSKPRRTLKSFEDFCEYPEEVCVIPGARGDLQEWKDGLCRVCNIKDRPEFNTFTGETFNNKFGLKGNLAYPPDYVFLAFPVDDITRKLVQEKMPSLGAKWLKDLIG
jgi:hypothetical protein